MALEDGKTIGLSLSGGGYRSTLFNLGALWRMNELGFLPKIDTISSVSGGSIVAAQLAVEWHLLDFDPSTGVSRNFDKLIAQPIEHFCSSGIDVKAGILGIVSPFKGTAASLADQYSKKMFKDKKLGDMPDNKAGEGPEFIILSTNYHTGSLFRFTRDTISDYRLGYYRESSIPISIAVAASSAFPPIFAPLSLNLNYDQWRSKPANESSNTRRWSAPSLVDGGVYDNLGLQPIRGNKDIVLVSDAGKPFKQIDKQKRNWFSQLGRVRDIGMNQALSRRKSELISGFNKGEILGSYWGIGSDIDKYNNELPFFLMNDKARRQASIRTRLDSFNAKEQGELINWGYTLCNAAIENNVPILSLQKTKAKWPKELFPL